MKRKEVIKEVEEKIKVAKEILETKQHLHKNKEWYESCVFYLEDVLYMLKK